MKNRHDGHDVVVVGMDPVGLASAYEAAKSRNIVLIIEKRDEKNTALRSQVVVLHPPRKEQLINMISANETLNDEDIPFLGNILSSAEIKLSDVQKFILNRIKQFSSSVDIEYSTELNSVDL